MSIQILFITLHVSTKYLKDFLFIYRVNLYKRQIPDEIQRLFLVPATGPSPLFIQQLKNINQK